MKKKTQRPIKEVIQKPYRGRALREGAVVVDKVNLIKLRESAGLSQKELSEKMLVSARAVIMWESGERRIHPAFFKLAEYVVGDIKKTKSKLKIK